MEVGIGTLVLVLGGPGIQFRMDVGGSNVTELELSLLVVLVEESFVVLAVWLEDVLVDALVVVLADPLADVIEEVEVASSSGQEPEVVPSIISTMHIGVFVVAVFVSCKGLHITVVEEVWLVVDAVGVLLEFEVVVVTLGGELRNVRIMAWPGSVSLCFSLELEYSYHQQPRIYTEKLSIAISNTRIP